VGGGASGSVALLVLTPASLGNKDGRRCGHLPSVPGAASASRGIPDRRAPRPAHPHILGTVSVSFDPRSALIVVDVQNDFADPRGALFVAGGDRVAPRVRDLMRMAASQAALVVCSQDWHPPRTPHFQDQGGLWPRHCVQRSWGARLHPCLPAPDQVIRKGQGDRDGYSAFAALSLTRSQVVPTALEQLLTSRGVEVVFVAGLALDVCVKATALDSARAGFATRLIVEATAAVNLEPGDGERALKEMAEHGVALV
jgi:nicotinamidase/pyrazinamidase